MRGSITLERGWCHDSDVGMDYFSFCYLSLPPLLSFPPTIVLFTAHPLVLILDFTLFTHIR